MANIHFTPLRIGTSNAAGERISSVDPLLSRTNYFDGQLLKAADLNRDQIYLDERLLELGQVFGAGIVRGLEPSLHSGHLLEISPGIAIAPSGRVLQLSNTALRIDLLDSGLIATLNDGRIRSPARGLHALALTHTQVVDGVAEAFPKDLSTPRAPHVAAWAEGVELRLMPLPLPLPRQDEIAVRAGLARELLSGGERLALPSDDAVALGLIAVERGRILWLDRGLLRRPQRPLNTPDAIQRDLAVHYQELMQAVLAARRSAGLRGAFAASQYFRVLPPWGPLPQEAIDPVGGSQQFFPHDYEVAIAPVRRSELSAVLADSARLAPIDLERDADCDVMVLVPMSDSAFALRARQLEAPAEFRPRALGRLANLDRLALRILPRPPIHRVDTDADVWRAIWAEADPSELIYVRRPPRTAETGVSALVLALGANLPPPGSALPPDAAALEEQLDAALEAADAAVQARAMLESEAARSRLRIAELEKALAATGAGVPSDLLAEVERLGIALETARAEIAALEAEDRNAAILANALEAASDRIDALKSALDAANAEIERLQTTSAPVDETLKARIEELAAALGSERARSAALEQERAAFANRLAAAELTIARLEREAAEAAAAGELASELSLALLARARGADEAGIKAAAATDKLIGTDARAHAAAVQIVGMADRRLDPALWPTLPALARLDPAVFMKLRDHFVAAAGQLDLAKFFLEEGAGLGLSGALLELWKRVLG